MLQAVAQTVPQTEIQVTSVQTPLGNTGLNVQGSETIPLADLDALISNAVPELISTDLPQKDCKGWTSRVDWLQGCAKIPGPRLLELLDKLADLADDSWGASKPKPVFRGRSFETSTTSLRGGLVAYNCPEGNDMLDCFISLPGCICGSLDLKGTLSLLKLFNDYGFHCTKIHLAIDDFDRTIQAEDLRKALKNGDFAYFQDWEWVESGSSSSRGKRKLKPGSSFTGYMGSKKGDKQAYIYDKAAESNGEIMSVRLEVEFSDERAQTVIQALLSQPDNLLEVIAQTVLGAVDFKDRSSGRRACRCPNLSWWSEFTNSITLDRLKIPSAKRKLLLSKTFSWLDHQVSSSLALIKDYLEPIRFKEYLDSLIENGRERRSPRQRALLELKLRNN